MEAVIANSIDQLFTPKDHDDRWRLFFGANTSSGYDFSLVIENPETKVSYLIEVGIMGDGRLCGQISPDANGGGSDALVIFDTSPETATVQSNRDGAKLIIGVRDKNGQSVIHDAKPAEPAGFY